MIYNVDDNNKTTCTSWKIDRDMHYVRVDICAICPCHYDNLVLRDALRRRVSPLTISIANSYHSLPCHSDLDFHIFSRTLAALYTVGSIKHAIRILSA